MPVEQAIAHLEPVGPDDLDSPAIDPHRVGEAAGIDTLAGPHGTAIAGREVVGPAGEVDRQRGALPAGGVGPDQGAIQGELATPSWPLLDPVVSSTQAHEVGGSVAPTGHGTTWSTSQNLALMAHPGNRH